MCHFFLFSFQLHDNALALHDYTRDQRKKARRGRGSGFDGELDNFQEPELSSLVRLVRFRHAVVSVRQLMALSVEYG
jgi:hypothetical protein